VKIYRALAQKNPGTYLPYVLQFRSEVLAILTETVMIPDAPELAGKRRGRFRLELQKNKI
jgi:hypothetical protein